ncbi:hypothetical protein [Paremcibacter congregatus]|uniref:Uncharacterized protein n=1 Tax=Paremcibacter congregatus TaxID=2043170 RepID=A0A2G4YYE9_9PROT|nr:hypothetical protein [Paremcibacter congregatus]PHZ86466.1 hypothetical protein CRD36_00840 [Paremcibacter congregatus]QDE28437.1 hypothetical protein FIV45_14755 [Paremcibacter congregatus]|tara:strand:- start:6524 stop:7126 length:603 start_codon:yes stop_codon:yes gene_type:complete
MTTEMKIMCDHSCPPPGRAGQSFRKIRKARRLGRLQNRRDKALRPVRPGQGPAEPGSVGPTPETRAKLTPDPLLVMERRNILNDRQLWAFRCLRRALQMITAGTQVRISRLADVVVQTSRCADTGERDHEIQLKESYSDWVDRMTADRLPVGPILDIILDELSFSAVDRKWARRKGWAKSHLQAGLNLYGATYGRVNRHE